MTIMKTVVKAKQFQRFFKQFSDVISSPATNMIIRTRLTDFSRSRTMTFDKVLFYLIFRNRKCAEADLVKFFSQLDILHLKISKQALHMNLRKVNINVFRYLFMEFAKLFYSSDLELKYREKYTLLAEDGTFLQIPYLFSNIEYFGFQKSYHVKEELNVNLVQCKASGLYDVTNGFFVDFLTRPVNYSELPLAYNHIERCHELFQGKNVIYLADRYYGSAELISTLEAHGYKYCIRGKSNFYKKQIAAMKTNDEEIEVLVDEKWLNRFNHSYTGKEYREKNPVMKIRVVKFAYTYYDRSNHQPVSCELVYFTNLPKEEFSSADIVKLYSMRWDIEVAYKVLKSDLEIERHISRNRNVAQSAMYGKVIFFNLMGILRKAINRHLEENPTIKYETDKDGNEIEVVKTYVVNIHQLINCVTENGIMENMFNKTKRKLAEKIDHIAEACIKMKVPIRPDRHNERWGRVVPSGYYYRFSLDGRNFPKLKTVKGVMRTTKP